MDPLRYIYIRGKNRFTAQHFIWELFSITWKGLRGIHPRPLNINKKGARGNRKNETTCSTHELPWKQPGNINNQSETFKGIPLPPPNRRLFTCPTAMLPPPRLSFWFQWVSIRKWHRFGFTLHVCVKSPNYTLSSHPPTSYQPATHRPHILAHMCLVGKFDTFLIILYGWQTTMMQIKKKGRVPYH